MATSNHIKLGSLFDGSGGFPLAASMCGIEPVWASEVEPYPIAVTKSRFPNMKHLGSVTDVNGAEVEPVDIITFGSPCQDLSVAGKRAGLKHEANGDNETTRSGLFIEAVRIIKEMREATNGEYPTFALWENVPGAFSSNKGEDFRIVLEELVKIVEPGAVMPAVPKNGWPYADSYCGDGWSLAYRVFDAQYWGVPQRRRRIHLVVDFRGERAGEVLFEREGVRGYFETGRTPWQGIAADAQDCAGADDRTGEGAGAGGRGLDAVKVYGIDHAITTGGNCTAQGPCVYDDIQATLKASGPHAVAYTLKIRSGCDGGGKGAGADDCEGEGNCLTPWDVQSRRIFSVDGPWPALYGGEGGGHGYAFVPYLYIVRRLTPTECARLQGFADGWGDIDTKDSFTPEEYRFWLDVRNTHAAINGKVVKEYTEHQMLTWYNKLHTDSAEYKMWGNGIALPPALYCMQGIASALMEQELGGNQ